MPHAIPRSTTCRLAGADPPRPGRAPAAARRRPAARPARRRGFTIAELLISVAILAVLLAAVAVAAHAVLVNYAANTRSADVTQAARIVLHRMMGEVRTADAVTSDDHRLVVIPPPNDELITEIAYELTGGVLYCTRIVNGQEIGWPVIASSDRVQIAGFDVSRQTAVDGGGLTYTRSVSAALTLRSGEDYFGINASACPRRNLTY